MDGGDIYMGYQELDNARKAVEEAIDELVKREASYPDRVKKAATAAQEIVTQTGDFQKAGEAADRILNKS